MAGLDSRVGTIAVGKDADLNIFAGDPFAPTSGLRAVIIDGTVVHGAIGSGGDAALAAKE